MADKLFSGPMASLYVYEFLKVNFMALCVYALFAAVATLVFSFAQVWLYTGWLLPFMVSFFLFSKQLDYDEMETSYDADLHWMPVQMPFGLLAVMMIPLFPMFLAGDVAVEAMWALASLSLVWVMLYSVLLHLLRVVAYWLPTEFA